MNPATGSVGGAGGSSWIDGVDDGKTIGGNGSMPNPDGGYMTGREGNGHARITKMINPQPEFEEEFEFTGTIETLTVPYTGLYKIETWGGQGGTVGPNQGYQGAYAVSFVELNSNDILRILVAGQGGFGAGGGGSFVTTSANAPLSIAGRRWRSWRTFKFRSG